MAVKVATGGFDASELEKFNSELLNLAKTQFPKEVKAFMGKERNRLKAQLKSAYKRGTKKKTGNLLEGVKGGNVYLYNDEDYQVRVKNTAPHAPLIERGHQLTKIPVLTSGGQTIHILPKTERFVPGKNIVGKTALQFKSVFPEHVDAFVDELLEKGLK